MQSFECKSGINQGLTQSPSLTAMNSPESHQDFSPVRLTRNACCTVSPTLVDTIQSVPKPLNESEFKSVRGGQKWQYESLVDTKAPSLPTEHTNQFPSEVPRASYSENTENHASLSDLSMAAFVESLYTLEIAPSDGLTSAMLASQLSEDLSNNGINSNVHTENEMLFTPFSGMSDMEEGVEYAQSAFLHENLAFSVPSDMRWWDAAWTLPQFSDVPKSSSCQPEVPAMVQLTQDEHFDSLGNDTVRQEEPRYINLCKGSEAQKPESSVIKNSCCGIAGQKLDDDAIDAHCPPNVPSLRSRPPPEKVHCVPSPTGTHCSCRCDSGLALLSLERTLRHQIQDTPTDTDKLSQNQAMSSLVFTLSMSQSISQKCSCSTDCPTCKMDPSYRSSALLLISTALQIYARALQLFHDVLVADGPRGCRCSTSNGCCPCSVSSGSKSKQADAPKSSIDVRIGDYLPSGHNSRKIALYALKLELIDLERALARIHLAADRPLLPLSHEERVHANPKKSCCANESSSPIETGMRQFCLNPIDRLVIRKLHVQLNEVLHALEGMDIHDNFKVINDG